MIGFYENIRNGNLQGVASFLGSPLAETIHFGDLNFKSALEAAIVNQHVEVVQLIIALPLFQQALSAKDFNYISMAILSSQPLLIEALLAIPTLFAVRDQFDTTHTLEFLFRDIYNAGYITHSASSHQKPQLSEQHKKKALAAMSRLKTTLTWTQPQALKAASESKEIPFAKLKMIADSQALWSLMPVPHHTDNEQYQQVYYALDAMVRNKKLAHRMEIDGDASVALQEEMLNYSYSGSGVQHMLTEMQISFAAFIKNQRHLLEAIFTENDIEVSVLDAVGEDIAHIGKSVNGALLIPVHIQRKDPHVVGVGFFLDLCLITERASPLNQGARIFRMAENPPGSIDKTTARLIDPQQNSSRMTYEELLSYLRDNLVLSDEPLDMVPFTPQFSGNCSWSSCAKMMPFIAFYFRVYHAFLTKYQDEDLARVTAGRVAKACYRAWSCDDQIAYLKDYLAYYRRPECRHVGPDTMLLAKIYLTTKSKKPHQQQIKRILQESGILNSHLLEKGYASLLSDVKNNLAKLYASLGQALPAWITGEHATRLCAVLTNIYLQEGKIKTLEACRFLMLRGDSANHHNANTLIDEIKEQYLPPEEQYPLEQPPRHWLPSQSLDIRGKDTPSLANDDALALASASSRKSKSH